MIEKQKIYITNHQNEIILFDTIDDKKFFCTSHIDYIDSIKNNIIFSFSKMKVHHINSLATIEEVRDFFQLHSSKLNIWKRRILDQQNVNLNLISNIINNISNLIACINYLLQTVKESFNFYNIIDYKKYKNIQDILINVSYMGNDDLDFLLKNLNELTILINQFINSINVLKVNHFNILKIIQNIVNIQYLFIEKYPKYMAMTIESFLIDHNQDPILVLTRNENNKLSINESLKNIIMQCLNEYQKCIQFIKIQPDFKKYISNEVELFSQSILNKFNGNLQDNQFIKQLNISLKAELSKFHILQLQDMQDDKLYFNDIKNADNYFFFLLNVSKYHIHINSKNIIKVLKLIIQNYESYLCTKQNRHILDEIMKLINVTQTNENEVNSIESLFIDIQKQIEQIQKENKYFYFEKLLQTILKNLLDQRVFRIYHKLIVSDDDDDIIDLSNYYFSVFDLINFSSHIAYTQFVVDREFNFCIEKIYNQNAKKEIIQREKFIFKESKSKFIVHLLKEINDNKVVFPYFPLQGIYYCLYSQKCKINLSLVDRLIIIKEIAIGMNDLNSMKHCHGNLSISSIFLNSNKDAYIGEIAYDRYRENDLTKTPEKVIYRAPEIISSDGNDENILLSDIYSFGIIMYEILTGKSPQSFLRRKPRSHIYQVLVDGIKNLIFSNESNDNLNPSLYDIRGDSLIGAKEIIGKCLDKIPSERFQSFDEIIKSIENLSIYEKNREEIDYRIKNAKSAMDYNCHLCDIVESYYHGNQQSSKFIEKTFDNISNFLYSFSEKNYIDNGDLIKNIYDYFGVKSYNDY